MLVVFAVKSDEVRLTARDAKRLVESTPEVLDARVRGRCPVVTLTWSNSDLAWLQARAQCNTEGGTGLIGNYSVKLRSGVVAADVDFTKVYDTATLRELRARLFADRALNRLDADDAKCLVSHLPAVLDAQAHGLCPTVHQPRAEDDTFEVSVSPQCNREAIQGPLAVFVVDRYDGSIKEQQSGTVHDSCDVGELRQKLIARRGPPELTSGEARMLVETLPQVVKSRAAGECVTVQEDYFRQGADELWFAVHTGCTGRASTSTETSVTVNVLTGAVRDPATLTEYESPDVRALGVKLLKRAADRKRELSEEAQALCRRS
jgi:hypothetical protein